MNPYTESTAKRPRDEGEEDEESNKTGRITISSIPPLPPAHSETGIFEPSPPSSIENAINTATKDRLAKTLHRMILGSSEVRQLAESHLLVDHEAVLGTSTASSWTKRKKYEICKHCSKEYDILRNKHLDCMYHPGILGTPGPTVMLGLRFLQAKKILTGIGNVGATTTSACSVAQKI